MVEIQRSPVKEQLRKLGKEVYKTVKDNPLDYVLPAFAGILFWEVTKDPKWVAGAVGIEILVFRHASRTVNNMEKEEKK